MTGPPPLFYPHDPPAASPLLPHALVLAPPRLRLAAQLIDLAAVGALSVLVAVTTRGTPAVALLVIVLYPSVMTALCGGTAGKLACRIHVVRIRDGGPLTGAATLARHLALLLMLVLPSALWCLWDRPYRQCLHDKVAGSAVVRRR